MRRAPCYTGGWRTRRVYLALRQYAPVFLGPKTQRVKIDTTSIRLVLPVMLEVAGHVLEINQAMNLVHKFD